jgi:DNA-binding CsgD family transcriptional regulator|tara:strand:+ start:298 stop:1083 length:786 start_codon:yes stop_codon:yes gene_type:complete
MEVYKGPHLLIEHKEANSRLICTWKSSPVNDLAYRKELIEHLNIAQKIKPNQIVWNLGEKRFTPTVTSKKWVDESILKPIFKAGFVSRRIDGFDQMAFVTGRDVLVLMQGIEKPTAGFNSKYFATEKEAISWLNEEPKTKDYENQNLSITFKGRDENDNIVFELKEQGSEFHSTINVFKTIIEQNHFMRNNVEKYSSLTPREKETLKLIIKGYTNNQIAEKLCISNHTVRTHRNRIWKKLGVKQLNDCLKYQWFFDTSNSA